MHTSVGCGYRGDTLEVSAAFESTSIVDSVPAVNLDEDETLASVIEAASAPAHESSPRRLRATSRANDGASPSRARSARSTNK